MSKEIKDYVIEEVDINSIRPDDSNPNEFSPEAEQDLMKSVETFGTLQPILIDSDNNIIEGHHRWKIYKHLGKTRIQVYRLNLTDGKKRVLRQLMNKIHGEHNKDLDLQELRKLMDSGDLELLKECLTSQERELNGLLNELHKQEMKTDPDEIPETPKESKLKTGDLITLGGKHKLLVGDSTKKEDVERLLNSVKIDLLP